MKKTFSAPLTLASLALFASLLSSCGKNVDRNAGTFPQTQPPTYPTTPIGPGAVPVPVPVGVPIPVVGQPQFGPVSLAPSPSATLVTPDQLIDGAYGCYHLISVEQAIEASVSNEQTSAVVLQSETRIHYLKRGKKIDDETALLFAAPGAQQFARDAARLPAKIERESGLIQQDIVAYFTDRSRVGVACAAYGTFHDFISQGGWSEIRIGKLASGKIELFLARGALGANGRHVIRATYAY